MKRAHVQLRLGGLSASLTLTPGTVAHPMLIAIESQEGHEPPEPVDDADAGDADGATPAVDDDTS